MGIDEMHLTKTKVELVCPLALVEEPTNPWTCWTLGARECCSFVVPLPHFVVYFFLFCYDLECDEGFLRGTISKRAVVVVVVVVLCELVSVDCSSSQKRNSWMM